MKYIVRITKVFEYEIEAEDEGSAIFKAGMSQTSANPAYRGEMVSRVISVEKAGK